MQNVKLIYLLLVTTFTFFSTTVNAGIMYHTTSTATISLNASSPDDISFVGIIGNYNALATATSHGVLAVDSAQMFFNRNGAYSNLSSLLFPFTSVIPSSFDNVNAVIGGAEGRGRNDSFSSGNVARFKAEAFGEVIEPVESAYSRVRWDVLLAFQNTSDNRSIFSWDLNYLFFNSAVAELNGTAFSTSSIRAQQGKLINGERNMDPKISEVSAAKCGLTTNCLPGNSDGVPLTFNYSLNAGEIGFLNFEVTAEGSASVVPEPKIIWLLCTGALVLICFRNRGKES